MKFPMFIDRKLEEKFSINGFIHIKNYLNDFEINELKILFDSCYNYKGEDQGMWNSLYNLPIDRFSHVSPQILDLLSSKLSSTFWGFKAPVASFMTKNPNRNGVTELHRDFSVLDETNFQYRNVWIPLVDTNMENGALYALDRSHNFFKYPLPMFTKWPYIVFQQILYHSWTVVDAKAGDLVVYADRTLHGSFINQTNQPRPVVHLGLLPTDASLTYYHLNNSDNIVTVYDVPFSFYLKAKFEVNEGNYPVIRKFKYEPPEVSLQSIYREWPSGV